MTNRPFHHGQALAWIPPKLYSLEKVHLGEEAENCPSHRDQELVSAQLVTSCMAQFALVQEDVGNCYRDLCDLGWE